MDIFSLFIEYKNKFPKAKYQTFLNWLDECPEREVFYKYSIENNCSIRAIYQMLYSGSNQITKCLVCGKEIITSPNKNRSFCSNACKISEKGQKIIASNRKSTMIERYGVDCAAKSEIFREKTKQTCLEKYGTEYSFQSEDVKEKIKQTNLDRHGVEWSIASSEIREKVAETNFEKYGVANPFQSNDIKEKIKQTCLDKYGVEHPMLVDEVKEKIRQTCREKYNCDNPMQSSIIQNRAQKAKRKQREWSSCISFLKPFVKIISNQEDYIESGLVKWICTDCGTEHISHYINKQKLTCECHYGISHREKEIVDFIRSIAPELNIIENTREIICPQELDIYIPEKKLAIEFDGQYWHSNLFKDPKYHLNKTEMCENIGIQCLHIFETEWIEKQEIVKDILKAKLGLIENRIYARKTELREVSIKKYRDFLDLYHIQGAGPFAKIRYGLYFESELVSLIGIGKSRFKKSEIELYRFCTKPNYLVIGGLSKLLSKIDFPLVTYADRRYSTGNGYIQSGFKFVSNSSPNYFYFNENDFSLHSRIKFQKHKLASLLDDYDSSMTEQENMSNNGYLWIYDCGNKKFERS